MRQLVMALYSEGATDNRFLPLIIQRTAEVILGEWAQQVVEVLPVHYEIVRASENRADAILQAAQQTSGYQLLLIHADADNPTADTALTERVQPGMELVRSQPDSVDICRGLVPVVPVTMTEAWLLADAETLRRSINPSLSAQELDIPTRPAAIERIANPKVRLAEILRIGAAHLPRRRRRERTVSELYEPLGQQIQLDHLARLSAYQQFQTDLTDALRTLHYIGDRP